jgi:ABC-type Fe3+/spermidine/putrescine transport system ATPase subunit
MGIAPDADAVLRAARAAGAHDMILRLTGGYDARIGEGGAALSGGQRQRIALARALAVEPKVLLPDEPFGALDAKVRKELRRWLRRLHDELHITSIFVTHDQEEALEVADRVVLMNKGRVEQVGNPEEVYERPASPFVYGFLGTVNVFHGRASAGSLDLGPVTVDAPEHSDADDHPATVYARPHEIEIERFSPGQEGIPAVLQRILVIGPTARLELERDDRAEIVEAEISADRVRSLNLKQGETLLIRPRKMQVFLGEKSTSPVQVSDPTPPPTKPRGPAAWLASFGGVRRRFERRRCSPATRSRTARRHGCRTLLSSVS